MNSKKIMSILAFFIFCINLCSAQSVTLNNKDMQHFIGCWEGSLTYLDYSSNQPYTMSAKLEIRQIGQTNHFSFSNSYPKEPQANSTDTVIISEDGNMIDHETVRSKRLLEDGSMEIITEQEGEDGNDHKPAKFRFTYILGTKKYIHRKDVQFTGTSQWILRHEYSYKTCN